MIEPKFIHESLANCENVEQLLCLSKFRCFREALDGVPRVQNFTGRDMLKMDYIFNTMYEEFSRKQSGYLEVLKHYVHIILTQYFRNAVEMSEPTRATAARLSARVLSYQHSHKVSVCFFGDGASNEGSFHECLNMAAMWKLPVIFVCENNMYACNTAFTHASNTKDVAARAAAYDIPARIVDGQDVMRVHDEMTCAAEYVRGGKGPMLIECKTYRWYEHCVGDPDLRPRDEWNRWKARDAIKLFADQLIAEGAASQSEVDGLFAKARSEIAEAVEFGRNSPEPELDSIFEDVYSD